MKQIKALKAKPGYRKTVYRYECACGFQYATSLTREQEIERDKILAKERNDRQKRE